MHGRQAQCGKAVANALLMMQNLQAINLCINQVRGGEKQGCRAVTFLVGSGSGSGSEKYSGSSSSSGSGQNVPAPAPVPMLKSSYEPEPAIRFFSQKC